jgi:hypothetical protein
MAITLGVALSIVIIAMGLSVSGTAPTLAKTGFAVSALALGFEFVWWIAQQSTFDWLLFGLMLAGTAAVCGESIVLTWRLVDRRQARELFSE